MVWPWAVAPYRVTILVAVEVKKHKDELVRQAEELYHVLERSLPGDVVLDDDVAITVDDLDAAEKAVTAHGLTPFGHDDYEPGRRFYFFDWDGIEFEVVSYE